MEMNSVSIEKHLEDISTSLKKTLTSPFRKIELSPFDNWISPVSMDFELHFSWVLTEKHPLECWVRA